MPFKTTVFFGLLAIGPFLPAHAAVTNVTYGSFFFDPNADLSSSTNWISLSTIIPSTNIFTFTDTNAGGLRLRFYRIVEPL